MSGSGICGSPEKPLSSTGWRRGLPAGARRCSERRWGFGWRKGLPAGVRCCSGRRWSFVRLGRGHPRLPGLCAVVVAGLFAVFAWQGPLWAQNNNTGGVPPLPPAFTSFMVFTEQAMRTGVEWGVALGRLYPRGSEGNWVFRGDLVVGTESRTVSGGSETLLPERRRLFFGGAQLAVAWVWMQEHIDISEAYRVDPYLIAGCGANYFRKAREIAKRDPLAPSLTTGAGVLVRLRTEPPIGDRTPITSIDVVREHRFNEWPSRTQVRLTFSWARDNNR